MSDSDQRRRLSYAIRAAREERNLTPPQLAARLHRSASTVNRWESGKTVPDLLDLGPLCDALEVEPTLFAYLPPVPESTIKPYLRPSIVQVAEAAADLAVDERLDQLPGDVDRAREGKSGDHNRAPRGHR